MIKLYDKVILHYNIANPTNASRIINYLRKRGGKVVCKWKRKVLWFSVARNNRVKKLWTIE